MYCRDTPIFSASWLMFRPLRSAAALISSGKILVFLTSYLITSAFATLSTIIQFFLFVKWLFYFLPFSGYAVSVWSALDENIFLGLCPFFSGLRLNTQLQQIPQNLRVATSTEIVGFSQGQDSLVDIFVN
jgi:hypothetical protein